MAQYTVLDALVLCGVPHPTPTWNGLSPAQRVATDIFHDDFSTCRDKEHDELDEAFKGYATLSVAQGQIRLGPGPKEKIKAFVQPVGT